MRFALAYFVQGLEWRREQGLTISMNTACPGLGEGLPERRNPGKDSFQAEPRALRQWISALPLANASATARLLYQALRELNQLRVDPLVRLQALEALRSPVGQIAETVDRQIIGSSFPLPAPKQQLGGIAQEFQHELALGYRAAVFELCAGGRVPFLRGKYAALGLQRLIAHLGAQLSKGYLVYATAPEGLWRTLHDAYAFARFHRLEDKAVEDPLLGGASFTPRHAFSHAVLFAISNPYGLSQKDSFDAYAATRAWASACVVRDDGRPGGNGGIPVTRDDGPGYLPEERGLDSDSPLRFDIHALQQDLERQLQPALAGPATLAIPVRGAAPLQVGADLVRRLIEAWRSTNDRHHLRLPAGHEIETVIGLTALHFHLAGHLDFESFVRRARGPGISMSERDRAASWATHASDFASMPETYRATVLDQSLGGYRIQWARTEPVKARVGELVGIAQLADDAEPLDWMVGIIRWIRIGPGGVVDAGIELLAREARPAALRAIDAGGRPRPPVRAIQLASLEHDQAGLEGYRIVAPSVLERSAAQFELTIAPDSGTYGEDTEVQTLPDVTLIEQTGAYLLLAPLREEPAHADAPDDTLAVA